MRIVEIFDQTRAQKDFWTVLKWITPGKKKVEMQDMKNGFHSKQLVDVDFSKPGQTVQQKLIK